MEQDRQASRCVEPEFSAGSSHASTVLQAVMESVMGVQRVSEYLWGAGRKVEEGIVFR